MNVSDENLTEKCLNVNQHLVQGMCEMIKGTSKKC